MYLPTETISNQPMGVCLRVAVPGQSTGELFSGAMCPISIVRRESIAAYACASRGTVVTPANTAWVVLGEPMNGIDGHIVATRCLAR